MSRKLRYTVVTRLCNANKKGLTPHRRKSFNIKVPKRGLEPPRGLPPLEPESKYGTLQERFSITSTTLIPRCYGKIESHSN